MFSFLFLNRGVIAANKRMWWNDQASYILTPVNYVKPTTPTSTVTDKKVTSEETTPPDDKTKPPSDKGEEDDYDYSGDDGDDSGASTYLGMNIAYMIIFKYKSTDLPCRIAQAMD